MKKALVILMALSMVFAAFADEPAVTNEIAEFKGDATVAWGVDLDTGKTGFANSESTSLKFNLVSTGDKATTGEGIWGEIKVKIADDPVQYANGSWNGKTAAVDFAKIHILDDMLAIGIRSGSNAYGEFKPTLAVWNYNADSTSTAGTGFKGEKVGGSVTDGITIQFKHDLIDANVEFRSAKSAAYADVDYKTAFGDDATEAAKIDPKSYATFEAYWAALEADGTATAITAENKKLAAYNTWNKAKNYKDEGQYTNNYGMGIDLNVKALADLSLKVGFGMDFFGKNPVGIYTAADYKLAIGDIIYVKPQVAFTFANQKGGKAANNIIGAVLVGWNDDAEQDSVKWVNGKVRNGFSVATNINLSAKKIAVPLAVGVWDSSFVPNLKAGVQLNVTDLSKFFKNDADYVAFDCAYALEDFSVTPKFSFKAQKWDFYVYGAVDYTGIANTTITLSYESGALNKKAAGKLGLSAKVSF